MGIFLFFCTASNFIIHFNFPKIKKNVFHDQNSTTGPKLAKKKQKQNAHVSYLKISLSLAIILQVT